MKTYKTQEEVDADIKDGVLKIDESVTFEFHLNVGARLEIKGNIEALDIKAGNIEARNIEARNIKAGDIKAWDIKAGNIEAGDIKAGDIKARNIEAWNIEAGDINFYAVCFAYVKFICKSIKGRRANARYFCLDGEVEITGE